MTIDAAILDTYPPLDEAALDRLLQVEIEKDPTKLVVLDDDPTGVQTVHDVSVYTNWTVESIRKGFREANKVFYILTNSRGMTAAQTAEIHREIVANVVRVAREESKPFLFMSRSDSTLRGHYPLEPRLLKEGIEAAAGRNVDGEILCPFFKEGGRFTVNNIHYVKYGGSLVPAAETEFARDKTFGYTKSSIPEYIEEKTGGRFAAGDVVCIPLEMTRALDFDGIENKLMGLNGFQKVCVNAIDYCDIKVFAIALYRAMAKGKTFVFRTAAGLVKVMGGISDRPLLTRREMVTLPTANGGLVVVGSHTQKTTAQLESLLTLEGIAAISFNSDLVMEGEAAFNREVDRCVALEEQAIAKGKTAVCYTSRTLLSLPGDTKESALARSMKISDGVQCLVSRLKEAPAFIIAKGGITSSDIGTKALKVERANVMGQICPGIPVWQTGPESRFPMTPYVIFPGNVGDASTLKEAVVTLTESRP